MIHNYKHTKKLKDRNWTGKY